MTDRRDAIIEAVWQLLAEGGPGAISFRSVASAAGTSAGAVQHHFPTRGELIRVSAEAMLVRAGTEVGPSLDAGPDERLWELLRHSLPVAAEPGRLALFNAYAVAAAADPLLAATLAAAKDGLVAAVAALLDPFTPRAALDDATRLVALADGLAQAVGLGRIGVDDAHRLLSEALGSVPRRQAPA